jgi:hypothetical protein
VTIRIRIRIPSYCCGTATFSGIAEVEKSHAKSQKCQFAHGRLGLGLVGMLKSRTEALRHFLEGSGLYYAVDLVRLIYDNLIEYTDAAEAFLAEAGVLVKLPE